MQMHFYWSQGQALGVGIVFAVSSETGLQEVRCPGLKRKAAFHLLCDVGELRVAGGVSYKTGVRRADRFPESGEIGAAVSGAGRGAVEVGLAVREPWNSGSGIIQPLRKGRGTHQRRRKRDSEDGHLTSF